MASTYTVMMIDAESLPESIDALATIDAVLGQDSGKCRLRLVTDHPEALEAAMDEAEEILDYEAE